ncbi:hypothetical protein [Otoolea muris]|uniref:hypothetical protein n=1 Tax=Otoolea muris TaxID=2941515 RepID=UPI0020402980|nr:hypothetical protein [Otoolea muris]
MAVIGAVIGAGVLGAVIYDNYGNYGNYSDYDNYSNYSDAAERSRRRREAKNQEIDGQKLEINAYKANSVNEYLSSETLKRQSGVTVSVKEVKEDGDAVISGAVQRDSERGSAGVNAELDEIDKVLTKIDKILKEGE